MFRGKARRRRENFEDLALIIVDFMKEIDEIRPLKPQNFLGAFGADYLSSAYRTQTSIFAPLEGGLPSREPQILKSLILFVCADFRRWGGAHGLR